MSNEEKLYTFLQTMASPSCTIGAGSVVALPAKIAKELKEAGVVQEYKGQMAPNARYETATAKADTTTEESENPAEAEKSEEDQGEGTEEGLIEEPVVEPTVEKTTSGKTKGKK